MTTLVCFHAHPDDESIATGGVMAQAKSLGYRVVLVVATRGEHGEPKEGALREDEQLGIRRIAETLDSAFVLGVDRVEFLGYVDSGMMGTPENDGPYSFWTADVEHAAERLATILRDEDADVLTVYDDNGSYGHPDHIQVHRVGVRAAEMCGIDQVFESTINRDLIARNVNEARMTMTPQEQSALPDFDPNDTSFGVSEDRITHIVDVSEYAALKKASMRTHASQISEDDFFLSMPDDAFIKAFGVECFIEHGKTRAVGADFKTSIFEQVVSSDV